MSARRIRIASFVALLTAAPILAGPAHAQVPEGHAVIGTHTVPGNNYVPGTPGLFLADLGAATTPTRVTGLPPELSTDGLGGFGQGAWCLSHRSSDGAIIVGMITGPLAQPSAGANSLWVLYLDSNSAVIPALTQQIYLGTGNTASRCWNGVLPDGRILVAAGSSGPFPSGPMAGHLLAIVDTSGPSPAFTLLPNPVLTGGFVGGLAVDPSGKYLYYVDSTTLYGNPSDAFVGRYDLATGQTCLIATLSGESAFGIACDDDGTVYVSATNVASTNPPAFTHSIYTVHPDGCNPATATSVPTSTPLLAWGLDLDRASDQFVAGCQPGLPAPHFNAVSLIDRVTGTATVAASAPAAGWGTLGLQCVAVNNRIESYGASSPGSNRHWFANFPNPGGQPTVGNLGFTLTMASAPNTATLSLMALALDRGSMAFSGIEILLDPNTTVASLVDPSVPYALSIPNDPTLAGQIVTAQSLHLEANNSLTASRGLTLTIQ